MSETLSEKRCRFTRELALLIQFANGLPGHAVAADQVMRPKAQALVEAAEGDGIPNSLHTLGLAVDLILYVNGVWQRDSEPYRVLGSYWRGRAPDHCWGGDFRKMRNGKLVPAPDGNHFSIQHNGVR